MSKLYNFLKSAAGKLTMGGTTALAGVAGNVIASEGVKDELTMQAIRDGVVEAGGPTIEELKRIPDEVLMDAWLDVKNYMETTSGYDEYTRRIYECVNANLDKVDIQSHYQPSTLVGTAVAAAIPALIWAGLYIYAKKHSVKDTQTEVENIK